MRKCPSCGKEVTGRTDKKFCSHYCKSAHHYEKNKAGQTKLYQVIDKQLKLNRKLLKQYNKSGKATVRKQVLLNKGFNPKFFTHYWKNAKGNAYLFCYEFGFMPTTEHGRDKYVLVQWQDYMQ